MEVNTLWIYWTVYFFCTGVTSVFGSYENDTMLRTTLETGYKQTARPGTPTTVYLFYVFRSLQDLDITKQQMTTTGWLGMHWYDPRLVWNASDYGNISEIDANWVWRPENYVTNAANDFIFYGYDNSKTRFHLFSDGIVRWDLPVHVTSSCDVSISRFPFDSQSCYIEFMFMEVNNIDVILNVSSRIESAAYLDNGEWRFDGGSSVASYDYSCCPVSPVTLVHLTFNFTRLRPFYVINLIIPAMLLSLCMVMAFLLPTDCGERLGFSLTILLSYTVLMSIISDMMPTTSKETPHINIYLLILLIMCTVCVLNVVVSVKMFYIETKPPRWVQKVGSKLHAVAFLHCCRRKDRVIPADKEAVDGKSKEKQNRDLGVNISKTLQEKDKKAFENTSENETDEVDTVTWKQIAAAMDRMCFILYSMICLMLMFMFSMALNGIMM